MKILSKQQFKKLMDEFPNGGIVFSDEMVSPDLMVTDGKFGATCVIPDEGAVYSFDWNIEEYRDDDHFVIYDNSDVLQMIQTPTSGLRIQLHSWWEE